LPVSAGYLGSARGYGVHDMATTAPGGQHRAGGELAFHVLDVMESLMRSADQGKAIPVRSTCERPAPVPLQQVSPTPWPAQAEV